MAVDTIKIDDADYTNYVIDGKPFSVETVFENNLNSPTSSEAEMTLENSESIHELFLNNQPYSLYSEGKIEMFEGFPSVKVYEGYIDKSAVPTDLRNKIITLKAIGKEQQISNLLSNYDISKAYYGVGGIDETPRQRGGHTGTVRFDHTLYNRIDEMVQAMLEDIGFDASDIIINYSNQADLKYRYNTEKFGNIAVKNPIAKLRNMDGARGRVNDLDSLSSRNFAELDKDAESYNSFIKMFAKLTGCLFCYDYSREKALFINRDYDFSDDLPKNVLEIDDLILDEDILVRYHNSYNGVAFKFEDITIVLKLNRSGIIPGGSIEVGVDTDNHELLDAGFSLGQYLHNTGDSVNYYIGGNDINQALYVSNVIDVQIEAPLSDFIEEFTTDSAGNILTGGNGIDTFMRTWVYNNYTYLLDRYREVEIPINGCYYAPLRINWGGTEINVFDCKIDQIKNQTRLRFEY